jgi:hypothetical protein
VKTGRGALINRDIKGSKMLAPDIACRASVLRKHLHRSLTPCAPSLDALADGALGSPIDPEKNEELSAINAALCNAPVEARRAKRFDIQFFNEHLGALLKHRLLSTEESAA